MRRVHLYSLKQPAIIVKAETGIIYSNQTGGVCCHHPEQEGFLVILPSPPRGITIFDPRRWYEEMPALGDTLYDEIEHALNGSHAFLWGVAQVEVDRQAKNEEAWVHIRFRGDFSPQGYYGGLFRPDPNRDPEPEKYPLYEGVLSWENCD